MVLNLKCPNVIFSWKKSNTWVISLMRMVEDQILNELLQIKDIPSHDNIASLQIFLGLANCYQILISNMHDLRAYLLQ